MAELTNRERFIRTIEHRETDRILMVDSPWGGTVRRWHAEGMPENTSWENYFGFDRIIRVGTDNSPRFPKKLIEETERYRIGTTDWGVTRKNSRELDSTPENLDYYYGTSERWAQAKARMTPDDDRIPWDWLKNEYPVLRKNGEIVQLGLHFGFDVTHSGMVGTENMLIGMYEEPDWIKDMFGHFLDVSLALAEKMLAAGYEFDCVHWYDDMGYKNTTFFSLDMYRELLKPFHKKACDWAHERGMAVELHSCGYIEPFIPDLIEIGVNMLNPLEVKAGMNPVKLKEQYGDKLAFHGGVNAVLWDKPGKILAEIERVVPKMKEGGGYIFSSDHSIPNSVSLEDFRLISDLVKRLGRY